ncbi:MULTISPECIES: molybdate ABC transporter substrate-binding protein [unclassified Novosphingobium]|uniref:molybdate ABC transporter substrate-binding protein n=1 Tax=unclassified Novosphingobium TaxID=2644732 RepID=UPI00086E2699|nr:MULTISPECIES: molybdate ABC transporter substrate-binding protein [unclassified Novosphingobium]MBN9145322.1 molybdate ABC transporter substrate-binding protein [Novosphingobium sp.]MDR6709702.1 molybdate transport system substrate-binding protein [Novosphingobium sp. 1748]ODU80300.1 MAG: molybdate ABC transporter substrate-binding protein [Novosphingobium sp. SCN 63-17]OJX88762.1 MAG: molybdate ABC transporter substrate-binding protein [Novosphingobium sp. 63-713]
MFRRMIFAALILGATPAMAQASRGPVVLAAASLQESLNAAADTWAAQGHPRPVLSFAASSALARQIENGAPADLFLSADEEWMDHVVKAPGGRIKPGTRISLLTNSLALIAPAQSRVHLTIAPGFLLAAALGPNGRLAMGQVASVPAGKYGREALIALRVWPSVEGRVAGADSVRSAMALVSRGEAPLGIVYATDARADKKVRVVGIFPANSHKPIVYPLARLSASTNPDAEGFRRFLASSQGKAIFRAYGFGTK